jgi:lipopolysaccharide biosynthesis regulator YciM
VGVFFGVFGLLFVGGWVYDEFMKLGKLHRRRNKVNYTIRLTQTTAWEVEVEADDEAQAMELTKDWGRDELSDEEIVSNCWDTEVR